MIKTGYSPHIEVSLDNLLHNLNQIRSLVAPGIGILAVVKDSAYGCGSRVIARFLEHQGGIRFFAVARPEEAVTLRSEGIESPILVLGEATPEELSWGWEQRIIFTLNDLADLQKWISDGLRVRFHINIDTGMGRMGVRPDEIDSVANYIKSEKNLHLEGVFTHMASADVPHTPTVDHQLALFRQTISHLRSHNLSPTHIHFGNSATLMRFPIGECTLVRPGIALYGCKPDPFQHFPLDLRPVVSLKSTVIKIKQVPQGTSISYGGHYVTAEKTWIATIAMGYAHGIPRFLSNRGEVLIKEKRYRIAGNVTMDYIMVDAGPNPLIQVGDEVVAMGYQGKTYISPDEVARLGGSIGYEILCNLGTSVDRFYLLDNSIVVHSRGSIF